MTATRSEVGNYFPWWVTLSQWAWLLGSMLTNATAFNMLICFKVPLGGARRPDATLWWAGSSPRAVIFPLLY